MGVPGQSLPPPNDTPERQEVLDTPEAGGKAVRAGAGRTIAYFGTALVGAATVPFMTRHLGVADFGRFVTASAIVMIVAGVTEFGLTGVGTREYVTAQPAGRDRVIGNLVSLRVTLTGVGLLLALLFMTLGGYPDVVVAGMLISGAGLIILIVQQTYALPYIAELRWGLTTFFDATNTLVIAAATLILVVVGASLIFFFWVSVVSSVAALAVTLVCVRRRVKIHPRFEPAVWAQMLRLTAAFAAASMVAVLYPRVALLVVSSVSSGEETGFYSTSYKIVEVFGGISGMIAGSAFPIFARAGRDDHERLRYGTTRVIEVTALVGGLIALSLAVAAPFIIEVIAGTGFKGAVVPLQIQSVALVAGFLAGTWSNALLSLHLHKQLLLATLAALAVAVLASVLLVPHWGARGAALAAVVAEVMVAASYALSLARAKGGFRPPVTALLKTGFAALVAGGVAASLDFHVVLLWAIATAIYVGLVTVLGAVPRELIPALLGRT